LILAVKQPNSGNIFQKMLCIFKKLSRILQSVFEKQELKGYSDV